VLRLYDTATASLQPVAARRPGEVSMYVCGPTVYGEPHAGHGRFTLVWDVIRRYLTWRGLSVRYVSNITDVDDKIIARAAEAAISPGEVAAVQERLWWETMDALGVARPDEAPHATAFVGRMVELIAELVERGPAYPGDDGVYFAAGTVEDYGLLAHQPLASLLAGARVETGAASGKRAPADFALWKAAKPGEPTWASPWGPGRPGWHTECVVMSLDLLGEGFDLHGGGIDLAFPHHENERAQAVAAGRPFAHRWVHSGMVEAEGGGKMARSVGNTLSLPELVAAGDPRAYRMAVLQSHYRSPMTVSPATLQAAARAVDGLDAFAREFAGARGAPADPATRDAFVARMDDDLDTPAAVAGLFDAARRARAAGGQEAAAVASAVIEAWEVALGLRLAAGAADVPPEVAARALERDAARAGRDWATADRLRDELAADGWVVEDTPAGTRLRR
jgi:cysteinyl-tRNA synthetase